VVDRRTGGISRRRKASRARNSQTRSNPAPLNFRADPDSPYYDSAFNRDKTVLVYCASGGRSALAGKALHDLGYKDVRNLGSFKEWAESGGAVDKV
jgi:rhodanese-related sulfurtransferase